MRDCALYMYCIIIFIYYFDNLALRQIIIMIKGEVVLVKSRFKAILCGHIISLLGEMDYRFHAAHLDRGLTIHEAVPGGFNRAGEGL